MSARKADRIEISSITKAINATKTRTSTWVWATRSSKSLISAVGPPTSTRAPSSSGTPGRVARSQSMVSRERNSSGSTASTADSSALRLSSENSGGDTDTMLTAAAVVRLTASNAAACRGSEASPSGKVTRTRTGPRAPGPSASAAAATPPRTSWEAGNCRCRLLPSTIENAGAARISRTAVAARAETHGRRITAPTQRVQNRDWAVSGRRDQCSSRERLAAARPKVASTAGIRVAEVSTATATARIAPVAIDRSTGVLIR